MAMTPAELAAALAELGVVASERRGVPFTGGLLGPALGAFGADTGIDFHEIATADSLEAAVEAALRHAVPPDALQEALGDEAPVLERVAERLRAEAGEPTSFMVVEDPVTGEPVQVPVPPGATLPGSNVPLTNPDGSPNPDAFRGRGGDRLPIGVPEGYQALVGPFRRVGGDLPAEVTAAAERFGPDPASWPAGLRQLAGFPGFEAARRGIFEPEEAQTPTDARYFDGDEVNELNGMSPEVIMEIQADLIDAGYLRRGQFNPGLPDDQTVQSFREVLGVANRLGRDWETTLRTLTNFPAQTEDDVRPKFAPLPLREPDPASLAVTVLTAMQGDLGRRPTRGELTRLAGLLLGDERQAHALNEQARRAAFEAAQTAAEGEIPDPVDAVPTIDPAARFRVRFEELFRDERQFRDDRLDALAGSDNFGRSILQLDSAFGGLP